MRCFRTLFLMQCNNSRVISQVVPDQLASGQGRDTQVPGKRSERYHQRRFSTLVQCAQVPFTEHTADGEGKLE